MLLQTFENKTTGLKSHVTMMKLNGQIHYGVDVFDLDAKQFLPEVQFHSTREKADASAVGRSSVIRVALHVEQVKKPSKLFPRAINLANVKQRLRRLIRFVDPHPLVVETGAMSNVDWSVA